MTLDFRHILMAGAMLLLVPCFSQPDTLNRLNAKKRPYGYWVQYLDRNLNPTTASGAMYKGYELFDDGQVVYEFKKDKWVKESKIRPPEPVPVAGQPEWLNGTFRWFSPADSIPLIVREFKNGLPVYEIYNYHVRVRDTTFVGTSEFVDYTRQYNNIPGTYYYEERRNTKLHPGNAVISRAWFRKEKDKWKFYKIKD
jgi:hypothetical protein